MNSLPLPHPSLLLALPAPDEQKARERFLLDLANDPSEYLDRYTAQFGTLLNADNAATLFALYNENPAKYRVAVHPAAVWIRDELFRKALLVGAPRGRNRVVFTAGSNAAGKSTAIGFSGAIRNSAVVFDSTLSSQEHAQQLVQQALDADKRITILYVARPLNECLIGMLQRAATQGRVVSIAQLIHSHRGAVHTVRNLWQQYRGDSRFEFTFVDNALSGPTEADVAIVKPQEYTEISGQLHELLEAEYQAGRVSETIYQRVRGR